jgi:hypothetical protein
MVVSWMAQASQPSCASSTEQDRKAQHQEHEDGMLE